MMDPERDLRDMMNRTADSLHHVPRPSRRLVRRARLRRARTAAITGTAAIALAIGGFAGARLLSSDEAALIPANPDSKENPFVGSWVTTEPDGSTQTIVIRAHRGEDAYEIVVRNDSAGACSGAPSMIKGTGRLDGATELVIPSPLLLCDDRPPLEEQRHSLTFVHDPESDTLTDNFELVWDRGETIGAAGGMWPQSSLEEVREAQELADAGDSRYTWQVDPELRSGFRQPSDDTEIVARFLREELGWEEFRFMPVPEDSFGEGVSYNNAFIRCAAGGNPNDPGGSACAPTLDEVRYEWVSLDLAQLARRGRSGIWVVTQWRMLPSLEYQSESE
jgi:hypothetical protein